MASNTTYHEMIRDTVEDTVRLINEYVDEFIDDLWPSLLELQSRDKRLAFYRTVDWGMLRATSEQWWQRMSTDAASLEAADEKRISEATKAYGQNLSRQLTAFKGETQPLGNQPAVQMGAALPLPLGRFGG